MSGFVRRAMTVLDSRISQVSRESHDFSAKAAYLGGHPEAIGASEGVLSLGDGQLRWTPDEPLVKRWAKHRDSFAIDVSRITGVDFKGDADLKKAPSGYVSVLPGVATSFGGSLGKHPFGRGRLTKLLVVICRDDKGQEYEVVFANVPGDGMIGPLAQKASDKGGYGLMTRILAARNATGSSDEAATHAEPEARNVEIGDALMQLVELRERGLVSEDEFDAKRTEIRRRL